jgi:hypothetical protein
VIVNVKGYEIIVDEDMAEFVRSIKWTPSRPAKSTYGVYFRCYQRVAGVLSVKHWLHRYIISAPEGMYVDHINCNTLDNRRENLRLCTMTENMRNRGKYHNNTVGYRGVTFHKRDNRFQAQIRIDGKRLFLGYFLTAEDAHEAYKEASIKYHGEFGHT